MQLTRRSTCAREISRAACPALPGGRKARATAQPPRQPRRLAAAAPVAPSPSASGSSAADSAWKAWTDCLPQWTSSTLNKPSGNATDTSALAAAVKAAAAAYKPKPTLKVPSLDDLPEVPKNLHKRLELLARVQLAHYLDEPLADLEATIVEFTTTDIAAACSAAGVITVKGKARTALVSLVVTETERQMTWSRLEGLLLHWAVSRTPPPKGEWELPPRGWRTLPDTTIDAGGAWQTTLEKHPLPEPDGTMGPAPMYTALLSLPLEGPLSEGGLIFVLKSGSTGQNTKWLKDAKTTADFFIDLQELKKVTAA